MQGRTLPTEQSVHAAYHPPTPIRYNTFMPTLHPRKSQNTTGTIRKNTISVDLLTGCARCGELHRDLVFKKFKRKPRHGITHWCLCPKTGDPILMCDVKRLPTPRKAVKK